MKCQGKWLELAIWFSALAALFFMSPEYKLPSLCAFKFLGFNGCLGCGIGHAIHYALHLEFSKSFEAHPMGVPAIPIILNRIINLSFKKKLPLYEP
jgi:hypothetical protein